jgi:membrane-bound metal-dependent hydrolase YbcI (DUF457 family)
MNGKTHILFGLLFGIFFIKLFPSELATYFDKFLFGVFLLFGSYFPDFDQNFKLMRHRTITHALYIPFICLILYYFVPVLSSIFVGFGLGYLSHLIGDMITLDGIQPFYPAKYKVSGPIRTGGVFELLILSLIAFLILFVI